MYIFDFEGTLSNCEWRQHLFPTKEDKIKYSKEELQHKYNIAHSCIYQDRPKWNNAHLYSICWGSAPTIILTAVRDILDHRQQIEMWLKEYKLPKPHKLLMRGEYNNQSSPEFKLNVCKAIKEECPDIFMFDDREDVIQKLMKNGIPGIIVS